MNTETLDGALSPLDRNNRKATMTEIVQAGPVNVVIKAYPNPAADRLILTKPGSGESEMKFTVYKVIGQLMGTPEPIYSSENGDCTTEISLNSLGLEPGVYILNIELDGKIYKEKIIYDSK